MWLIAKGCMEKVSKRRYDKGLITIYPSKIMLDFAKSPMI